MNDAIIVYKVKRQDARRVFYHGSAPMDTGYFFAPYRPGMSDEEIAEVNEQIRASRPTQFQLDVFKSIQDKPMLDHPIECGLQIKARELK